MCVRAVAAAGAVEAARVRRGGREARRATRRAAEEASAWARVGGGVRWARESRAAMRARVWVRMPSGRRVRVGASAGGMASAIRGWVEAQRARQSRARDAWGDGEDARRATGWIMTVAAEIT